MTNDFLRFLTDILKFYQQTVSSLDRRTVLHIYGHKIYTCVMALFVNLESWCFCLFEQNEV